MLHKAGPKKHGEHSSFLRDGSATTDTESRCRTMDGMRATSCCLTESPWKIIDALRQKLSAFVTRGLVS